MTSIMNYYFHLPVLEQFYANKETKNKTINEGPVKL